MSAEPGDHVLVLLLDEHPDVHGLGDALGERRDTSIRVVAPAHVGPLHWYATDEGDERAAAEARAEATGRALSPPERTEAAAGEADPVVAVEDALNDFRADRIVVVGATDASLDEALRRFHLPVEEIGGPGASASGGATSETGRALMSGRSPATPYAVLAGVMVVLSAFVAALLVIAALVLWL